jgi:hypothetical protein
MISAASVTCLEIIWNNNCRRYKDSLLGFYLTGVVAVRMDLSNKKFDLNPYPKLEICLRYVVNAEWR